MRTYVQLSRQERYRIHLLHAGGVSRAAIAREVGRCKSTISRELRRNTRPGEVYLPDTAVALSRRRKFKGYFKITRHPTVRDYIIEKLRSGWSPEQIAGRMCYEDWPVRVCAETIYRFIYHSSPGRRFELFQLLCKGKPRRTRHRERRRRSPIPNRLSITTRPAEANARDELGHLEADLMMFGRHRQNVLTLIDRKSRLLAAFCNESRRSVTTITALKNHLEGIPTDERRTVTFDNGVEFAKHQRLQALGVQTYFCDPYASWQKGSIENANGIIRRYLPKKSDPSGLTQLQLDCIVENVNTTPRKILGWRTPLEAHHCCTSN
jgi:IS30 family transposase